MKLKLDENFGRRCVDSLTDSGHDVATVAGQQMSGAIDEVVIQRCLAESRCLVTLDLDFSNLNGRSLLGRARRNRRPRGRDSPR